jgi:hypothetical protein
MRISLSLPLAFLLLSSQTETVLGQSAGAFTATGVMMTSRAIEPPPA